jgi:4-oxalocrotonate tautomerase family enzyme
MGMIGKYSKKGGLTMPFINIKVLKGTLSKEKKDEMIKRVSETVSEIEASPSPKDGLLAYTWCVIEEVEFDNWGIGGNACTPEILKAVIEGRT